AAASDEGPEKPPLSLKELVDFKSSSGDDALRTEAAKGYSIVVAGIESPIAAAGDRFDKDLQRLVDTFDGPLAIVINAARSAATPTNQLKILVPTDGTPEARLAMEMAIALAKASNGTVTALHVLDPKDDTALLRGRARRQGLSVLADARRLSRRNDV